MLRMPWDKETWYSYTKSSKELKIYASHLTEISYFTQNIKKFDMPIYFKCNLTMNNILQFSGFFLVALYFFLNLQKIADVGNFETLWEFQQDLWGNLFPTMMSSTKLYHMNCHKYSIKVWLTRCLLRDKFISFS